jgi:DNA mismatch repair protein MutL
MPQRDISMNKIHRLPDDLANQIAAGEVVERPAAAVKELVENAIDAGATRIVISTELGGKKAIRVEDDGEGMSPDDARLALERHATSKIHHADDLARISTLGFRGEALPSIASVSRFVLRTRARGAVFGTEIRINPGAVQAVTEQGMPEGTSVEVGDVFYNLPARRKFLKSDAAESAQISKIVTQLALCYAGVGFTLTSSGRTVLQVPPVPSLKDRLYQLYGERDDLVPVRRESGDIRVTGYVAALAEQGPARGPQNIFVNGRVVKDRTIAHAILDAYSVATIKERSPEVHLFIEMPPDLVDVNVHPTKAEVRFRDQSYVHQCVRRALGEALGQSPVPTLAFEPPATGLVPRSGDLPTPYPAAFPSRWGSSSDGVWGRGPDGVSGGMSGGASGEAAGSAGGAPSEAAWRVGEGAWRVSEAGVSGFGVGREGGGTWFDAAVASGAIVPSNETTRPMMPLGQFRDTFIIAVDDEGIAIIDQHVAHERILFERIMERLTRGRLESQRLLTPILVTLSATGRETLAAHSEELSLLGFEVDEFGGDEIRLTAVPALVRVDEAEAAVRALADDLEGLDRGAGVAEALKRIAATMACHAAVKANYPLTPEKMRHILEELRQTAYSTICPHGRPVLLRVTRREVEKSFQRI